jgi:hypothetical protein
MVISYWLWKLLCRDRTNQKLLPTFKITIPTLSWKLLKWLNIFSVWHSENRVVQRWFNNPDDVVNSTISVGCMWHLENHIPGHCWPELVSKFKLKWTTWDVTYRHMWTSEDSPSKITAREDGCILHNIQESYQIRPVVGIQVRTNHRPFPSRYFHVLVHRFFFFFGGGNYGITFFSVELF